jgi:hypothetical protein
MDQAWQRDKAMATRGVSEVGVSCCGLVFVDRPTEDVAAAEPVEVRRTPCFGSLRWHRRRVGQAAVRAVLVVMLDVASQAADKLLAADDQQLVQALGADCADPAFGVGVGPRRQLLVIRKVRQVGCG